MNHPDPRAGDLHDALERQRRLQRRLVHVPVHRLDRRTESAQLAQERDRHESPACRIRSAARQSSTQRAGSTREPRGRCVSEMTATVAVRA